MKEATTEATLFQLLRGDADVKDGLLLLIGDFQSPLIARAQGAIDVFKDFTRY